MPFDYNFRNKKTPKYRNKKVIFDGLKFDSKRERDRYMILVDMQDKGEISDLVVQPKFILQDGYRDRNGLWVRPITYSADFMYHKDNQTIVEDVKSPATAKDKAYRIKKKLFVFKNQDLVFKEIF